MTVEQGIHHATGHFHRMHQRPDQPALDAAGVFGDLVGHLLGSFEQHGNVEQGFLGADARADGEGRVAARGASGGGVLALLRRSWLASEGVGQNGARLKGLFAGKPAPTGLRYCRLLRRSWLASEGVGQNGARLEGLFAGKPAPTGLRCCPLLRRSWLASEGVGQNSARLEGLFAGKPAPTRRRVAGRVPPFQAVLPVHTPRRSAGCRQ